MFQRGFTLIELMMVVAVIAILSAIALPAFNSYRVKAAENACLSEAKSYANYALASIYVGQQPDLPKVSACIEITGGSAIGEPVGATPKLPGIKTVTCQMDGASSQGDCRLN